VALVSASPKKAAGPPGSAGTSVGPTTQDHIADPEEHRTTAALAAAVVRRNVRTWVDTWSIGSPGLVMLWGVRSAT
jgi:hypothetical protein